MKLTPSTHRLAPPLAFLAGLLFLSLNSPSPARAGANPDALLALDLHTQVSKRNCSNLLGLGPYTDCGSLNTHLDSTWYFDAAVVLCNANELRGLSFGLTWPSDWEGVEFISCSDMTIGGGLLASGFGSIAQAWNSCATGSDTSFVVGIVRGYATSPGALTIVPAAEGPVAALDCSHATDWVAVGDSATVRSVRHVWPGWSIQAAVDASAIGDEIQIHTGTYNQSVVVEDIDNLLIKNGDGEPYGSARVVAPSGPAFSFDDCGFQGSGPWVELRGLSVESSYGPSIVVTSTQNENYVLCFGLACTGGIQFDRSWGGVDHCRLVGNYTPNSVGVDFTLRTTHPTPDNVVSGVINSFIEQFSTGIRMIGPEPWSFYPFFPQLLEDTLICATGIYLESIEPVGVVDCVVRAWAPGSGDGIHLADCHADAAGMDGRGGVHGCQIEGFQTGILMSNSGGEVYRNLLVGNKFGVRSWGNWPDELSVHQNTADGINRPAGSIGFHADLTGGGSASTVRFSHNLAVGCEVGLKCTGSPGWWHGCSQAWDNTYDFANCPSGQACAPASCANPLFCGLRGALDPFAYSVGLESPCLHDCPGDTCCEPGYTGDSDHHVGAYGQGCGEVTSVEIRQSATSASWGTVKNLFSR